MKRICPVCAAVIEVSENGKSDEINDSICARCGSKMDVKQSPKEAVTSRVSDKKQKKVIFCTIFGVRFYRAAIGFFTKLALSRHRCCLLVVEGRCSARCIDAVRDSSSPDVNAVLKDKIL